MGSIYFGAIVPRNVADDVIASRTQITFPHPYALRRLQSARSATIDRMDTNPVPGKSLARSAGVVLLSLLAATIIIVGLIVIREWRGGIMGDTSRTTAPSEEEKLRILASLAATSTPSVEDRLKILQALREQQ